MLQHRLISRPVGPTTARLCATPGWVHAMCMQSLLVPCQILNPDTAKVKPNISKHKALYGSADYSQRGP